MTQCKLWAKVSNIIFLIHGMVSLIYISLVVSQYKSNIIVILSIGNEETLFSSNYSIVQRDFVSLIPSPNNVLRIFLFRSS